MKSAMIANNLPLPIPCLRTRLHNKGPGRNKSSGKFYVLPNQPGDLNNSSTPFARQNLITERSLTTGRPGSVYLLEIYRSLSEDRRGATDYKTMLKLVSLFASLLAIPLACQCCFHAALLTGLQIVGVTLYFLDNVLLLYLPLKPAQRIFERLAFLYANLCQEIPPPNLPWGSLMIPESSDFCIKLALKGLLP